MSGSDDYTLRARVAPAVIAVASPVALAVTLIPFTSGEAKVIPIAVAAFTALAGQLGRDIGEGRQAGLFQKWGGAPTTSLLRHTQSGGHALSAMILSRRRRQLEQLWGPGGALPTQQEELADPSGSDAAIDDYVAVLRSRTRDSGKFPLVTAENINYGFRRNCLGLKAWALWLVVVTLVLSVVLGTILGLHRSNQAGYAFVIPFGIGVLAGLWFWRSVTEDWVHRGARRYARSLLETLDVLEADGRPSTS